MASVVPPFINFNDCAAASTGGKILFATDDFFASAENLIKDEEPISNNEYTEYGKWMDGWETRRRRETGHDWCIIKLAGLTVIKGFHIDTGFFTGNYPPRFSIQGIQLTRGVDSILAPRRPFTIGTKATRKEVDKCNRIRSTEWPMLVQLSELHPGGGPKRHHYISLTDSDESYTHIRLNIHPDGGIARFKVYGEIRLIPGPLNRDRILDMLSLKNGGRCLMYSNAHYGHPKNLIKQGRGIGMADGWETARRLDRPATIHIDNDGISNVPGKEWAVFKLGAYCHITSIEVDTNHFKGNAPDSIRIGGTEKLEQQINNNTEWIPVLPMQKLKPNHLHRYKREVLVGGPFNSVKITIAPDGGVSRVRMFGFLHVDPFPN